MTKKFIIEQFLAILGVISKTTMEDEDCDLKCPDIFEDDCRGSCRSCWTEALEKELED